MKLVDFYHLDALPAERVVPTICEKIVAGGGRVLVIGDPDLLDRLDPVLWDQAPESFLAHGRAEEEGAELQPILLSSGTEAANGATHIALADGRWRESALDFERIFYFFGAEEVEEARSAWRALAERPGLERRYWKRDSGGKWLRGP